MSEAKPTPGPWDLWGSSNPSQTIAAPTGFVAQTLGGNDEANARLIADAGTVFHTTGLTPSQLVERVKELEEALIEARSVLSSVCTSKHRRVVEDGVVLYTQTEEWCRWAEGEVLGKVVAAISKARPNTAEGEAQADSGLKDAARESEYQRGYRHGYEQRDAEVRGLLA